MRIFLRFLINKFLWSTARGGGGVTFKKAVIHLKQKSKTLDL